MTIDIQHSLQTLQHRLRPHGQLSFKVRQPVALADGGGWIPSGWQLFGIYLITARTDSLLMPLSKKDELLYVGQVTNDLAGRIQKHLGRKYLDGDFSAHRWGPTTDIHADIKKLLDTGSLALHAIEIEFKSNRETTLRPYLWPSVIEKHILLEHLIDTGDIPPLNLIL